VAFTEQTPEEIAAAKQRALGDDIDELFH